MAELSPFNYYAYDLLTGTPLGQGPFRTVQFSGTLNGSGNLTGTIDLSDLRVQRTNPAGCTAPNRTFLIVDYQGVAIWGGIVTSRDWTVQSSTSDTQRTLTIQASEPWIYFGSRVQATDYSAPPFSGIDPLGMSLWLSSLWDASLIACQIIQDALGVASGNLLGGMGLLLNGATPSGSNPAAGPAEWIAVQYPFTTCQTVDMIISQLSQLGVGIGFDFGVDTAYSGGPGSSPVSTINLSYPRRGRLATMNNLIVDFATARQYAWTEDGTQTANVIYEIGGSSCIVVNENVNPINQGYPIWERVISRANAQSANIRALLTQTGIADLAVYSYAPTTVEVTIGMFGRGSPLGSFITGDDIRVVIPRLGSDGMVFDPRFPAGLDEEWRMTGYTASATDQGDAVLQLSLAQPPLIELLVPAV